MRGKEAQRKFVFSGAKWYVVESISGRSKRPHGGTMETGNRYYQLASRDMVYMKFVLEAYEGLSTMSTVDGKRGIVRVNYPLCFADDMGALMQALAKEIAVTEVTEGGEPCSRG